MCKNPQEKHAVVRLAFQQQYAMYAKSKTTLEYNFTNIRGSIRCKKDAQVGEKDTSDETHDPDATGNRWDEWTREAFKD